MSKKTNFLIVVVFIAIFSMVYYFSNRCVLDGETVCYNEKIGQFEMEENAHLKIHVESEEVAEQFKKLWAQEHPKHADKVELFVAEPKKIKEMVDAGWELMSHTRSHVYLKPALFLAKKANAGDTRLYIRN